ncbi:MAG: hypothetical protein EOT05_03405 [Candidatus Microsaccharimonas sossegonensis]|uniref:Uncharacterized protein n=1 Tax=Candidatus Microsaccharimonas sossegonensis TaxID=2506948 RepID=A0A4Q0AI95_9BACT|nr:MAG: hypothetical protein EOT05_03405 [Candidatus Microsaccharimonas sossegonensis]
MVQYSAEHYEKLLFERANNTLKTHGLVSIIFGALGILFGIFLLFVMSLGTISDGSYNATNSPLGLLFVAVLMLVFWFLPHIYLIVAGYYLMRQPNPRLAKMLIIINLVIGVFYNFILLVFAIINLTQSSDYEREYHNHHKPVHHES